MEKYDFALESYKNTQELIKFIDQKTAGLLVITGFLISVFTSVSTGLDISDNLSFGSCTTFIFGLSIIILLFYNIYLSIFKILKPRLANNYSSEKCSIYYYEHISSMSKNELYKKYDSLNPDLMLKQILDQVYEVSIILKKKTKYIGIVMNILWVSIILLIPFTILANMWRNKNWD